MNIENDIQVSVCVVTYNHENYIAECLESLVTQQTSFKFEIIVGEDCSKDSTRAIVQQYAEKYPDLIVPLFYEKNVGAVENVKQVYKKARGKYIAHIDGDDMALPNKLQKQFTKLEENLDCSICAHNMKGINKDGEIMKKYYPDFVEKKYQLLDLYLKSPFIIHSSKMFVNNISEYIDNIDPNMLDTEMHIIQAKKGDIYYLQEELGGYRQFVGVTIKNGGMNHLIPERIFNIYDNANNNIMNGEDLVLISEKYYKYSLQCAYQVAVNQDELVYFKKYLSKSIMLCSNIYIKLFLIFLYKNPKIFYKLAEIRNNYKLRVNKC